MQTIWHAIVILPILSIPSKGISVKSTGTLKYAQPLIKGGHGILGVQSYLVRHAGLHPGPSPRTPPFCCSTKLLHSLPPATSADGFTRQGDPPDLKLLPRHRSLSLSSKAVAKQAQRGGEGYSSTHFDGSSSDEKESHLESEETWQMISI